MKITETRKTERKIVRLYECSKKADGSASAANAARTVEAILLQFSIVSAFTEEDHLSVLQKLYFSRDNIIKIGVKRMADKVFIQERTLLLYRQKYCRIIDMLLEKTAVKP